MMQLRNLPFFEIVNFLYNFPIFKAEEGNIPVSEVKGR